MQSAKKVLIVIIQALRIETIAFKSIVFKIKYPSIFIFILVLFFSSIANASETLGVATRFVKLDTQGKVLSDQKTSYSHKAWACVLDQHSGLIWEVKTEQGLQSKEHTYTWYKSNNADNGGYLGIESAGKCEAIGRCDIEKYEHDFNKKIASKGFCGQKYWRLPTAKELFSIVDNSRIAPAIDTHFFPNTSSSRFWTASPFSGSHARAWHVHFYHGVLDYAYKDTLKHIRLVSGNKPKNLINHRASTFKLLTGCRSNIQRTNLPKRFIDNTDGTVTDTENNIMWQQCTLGRHGDHCEKGRSKRFKWKDALSAGQAFNADKQMIDNNWRLPSINELVSLVEHACFSPAIDLATFPNTEERYYWSHDPYAAYSWLAWSMNFRNGIAYYSLSGNKNYVRLVHDIP